jgi:hypothetical protein
MKRYIGWLGIATTLGAMGCGSVVGQHDVDATFTVTPKADGTYFWWNEVELDQDVKSFGFAKLGFVRLDALPPAKDLTFLDMVQGEAVTSSGRTMLVQQAGMPEGEPNVVLNVVHDGDLRPFFEDGHKVRVEWTGRTNPSFTGWPAEGITVNVKVRILLDD